MDVEMVVDAIDPGQCVIICRDGEMRGLFPGKFVPTMYYKEKVRVMRYDKDSDAFKLYIGDYYE